MPGGWEWIVILIVALLIFGKNLPDVARAIGKALTELRRGMDEIKSDVQTAVYESERESQKKLAPPKTAPTKPEVQEPYEPDDTEMFGDAYDNEGFTDITDEDRAAGIEAEQEQKQEDAESSTEEEPRRSEEHSSDTSQPQSPTQAQSTQPDEEDEKAL
ncbi:MAG: twin-arginine translocase TatA/TatE family subunit [Planctomycetota bacterium]